MITVVVENLEVVLTGIKGWDARTKIAAYQGIGEILKEAKEASYKMLNADAGELEGAGHPYSRTAGYQIDDPDETVHVQSETLGGSASDLYSRIGNYNRGRGSARTAGGDYLHSIETEPPAGGVSAIMEGKLFSTDPKDRWIQDGTTKMRPRPWMAYLVRKFGQIWGNGLKATILRAFDSGFGAA